jgi:hypothetical protein
MIKQISQGRYQLVGTKDQQKMLFLGDQGYLWSYAKGIGELLSFSKHFHKVQYLLAEGTYKIYQVKDEPDLVDLRHLELSVGKNSWQGYLLLTGLPTKNKVRSRIIPTDEIISTNVANR